MHVLNLNLNLISKLISILNSEEGLEKILKNPQNARMTPQARNARFNFEFSSEKNSQKSSKGACNPTSN